MSRDQSVSMCIIWGSLIKYTRQLFAHIVRPSSQQLTHSQKLKSFSSIQMSMRDGIWSLAHVIQSAMNGRTTIYIVIKPAGHDYNPMERISGTTIQQPNKFPLSGSYTQRENLHCYYYDSYFRGKQIRILT